MTKDKYAADIAAEEALDWYMRLRREVDSNDPLDEAERTKEKRHETEQFDEWVNANSENRSEFDQLDDCWIASKALKNTGQLANTRRIIEELKAEAAGEVRLDASVAKVAQLEVPGVNELKSDEPGNRSEANQPIGSRFHDYYKGFLVAASVVFAIILYWTVDTGVPTEGQRYITEVGERRVIELDDGSRMTLNTKSTVDVAYSEEVRHIVLIRGQANFEVAHNVSRPFVVSVGNTSVTALGTSFDIYKRKGITFVSLFEGSVEVVKTFAADSINNTNQDMAVQSVRLQPGEQVHFAEAEALPAASKIDLSRIDAWREGRMKFHDTPLIEAIREANRYSEVKLKLADTSLESLAVSGIFQTGLSEDFARAIAGLHGLEIRHIGADKLLLSRPAP